MECRVENGRLILSDENNTYSFEAHGEQPRSSMMGLGLSAAGKHWSDRDPDKKLEKHTGIQDIALGDGVIAWYTQEFIPDGLDYKLSKNAKIYMGDLSTGEDKLLYKGECYGDLCFYGRELYFNMGNKAAVINIDTGESEILFKHSGIKKNGIELKITPKRIFFTHWSKDSNNLMWYDRENKEVVNPHIDSYKYYYIDDITVIFGSTSCTWLYNAETRKKKRFFSAKTEAAIIDMTLEFMGVPAEYYEKYHTSWSSVRLGEYENDRLYFLVHASYNTDGDFEAQERESHELGQPNLTETVISCDTSGKDIRIESKKEDIVREEKEYSSFYGFDFPMVILRAKLKE